MFGWGAPALKNTKIALVTNPAAGQPNIAFGRYDAAGTGERSSCLLE